MVAVRTKFAKLLLLIASGGLLLVVFIIDIIQRSVDIEIGWITVVRHVLVLIAFALFYFFLESLWGREQSPAKKLGFALVLALVVGVGTVLLSLVTTNNFDIKNYLVIPLDFETVLWANIYGVVIGCTMVLMLLLIRDIIFSKRRKSTRRNFLILLILALITALSTLFSRPLESSIVTSVLLGVTIFTMIFNSFRLSWIVYLSKREKVLSIMYALLLFGIFISYDVFITQRSTIGQALTFYSAPLQSFISTVSVFATIYFGMTFVSTLFHLPTAEAFDRKISEVSSLHNLGRLVTQVFDFNELVDSVTTMTLQVCEAKSTWLEIIKKPSSTIGIRGTGGDRTRTEFETVARKNISFEETEAIMTANGESIRRLVLESCKPVIIDDVGSDKRTQHLKEFSDRINSMVIVPLLSHDTVIGILYAVKKIAYGFDREDVDLISAFADQATIAIENSRLIEKSIERERLMREMVVAQEMQRKLLPQQLPHLKEIEIEALSTPAFEVGGDYYDFIMLDDHRLGILVGDVSGKGVSAAFYMAEMKGIFQSLSRIYPTPKQFLIKAHDALVGSIDKRWFISIIYAILDLQTGVMTLARAGHCPMVFVSNGKAQYIKPTGLALGMGTNQFFAETLVEDQVKFSQGDFVVFYTDGLTEAHPKNGEEFGYDHLLHVVRQRNHLSAVEIRDAIILAIDQHMNHESPEDDLTILVLKWLKHTN